MILDLPCGGVGAQVSFYMGGVVPHAHLEWFWVSHLHLLLELKDGSQNLLP